MHENSFTIPARDLEKGPVTLDVDCTPEALELDDEEYSFEQVKGQVIFNQARPRVVARGQLDTIATTQCVRCLGEARLVIHAPVDSTYEDERHIRDTRNEVVTPEEQVITPFNGEWIQPEPELREAIMLELPTLPLCSEDCKGLCPRCGTNLNKGECDCSKDDEEVSSWKTALKGLKLNSAE